MHNRLKEQLRRGEVTVGFEISLTSLDVVELTSQLNFDWLWFDTEHAPLDICAVQPLLQAIRGDEVTPIVRVAANDPVEIKKALDIGSHGLVVPLVNDARDAAAAVEATRYPPQGIRGMGPRRAANYGLDPDYIAVANKELLVMVMIETREAIRNFDEILAVDGVDSYFIGPYDLSCSLGHLGEPNHPAVEATIDDLIQRGKKAGVPGGIVTENPELAQKRIDQGFQLLCLGTDLQLLHQGANTWLRSFGREGLAIYGV